MSYQQQPYGGYQQPPPQQPQYGGAYQQPQQPQYGGVGGYQAAPQQQSYYQPPSQQYAQQSQLSQWFNAVDRDHSGHITAYELRNALSQGGMPFDEDVSRKMVKMFDRDGNGQIDFNEFCNLHNYLSQMKAAFYNVDTDKSGSLTFDEVERAVMQAGYRVNRNVLYKIFRNFDTLKRNALNFDGYIKLCIYIGTVRQIFMNFDRQRNGYATFSFDDFTDSCLLFTQ